MEDTVILVMGRKLLWVMTIALVLSSGLVSLALADGPYRGRVIDAETKEPIEGAAVVAVWIREVFAIIQSNQHFAYAHEVLTNENGEFEMPGLPWSRRATLFLNPFDWLDRGQPEFYILKPGYGWYPQYHVSPPKGSRQEVLANFNNFLTIELPPRKLSQLTEEELAEAKLRLPSCPFGGMNGIPSEFIPIYIQHMNTVRELHGYSRGIACS